MNSVDQQYKDMLRYILKNGVEKKDRTGTGTLSVFSYDMRFKMSEGFPLITSKKMAWKPMVIELLWFLKGDTNIKYLVDNGCMIWVGDAYKNYQGKQFKSFPLDPDSGLSKDQFIERIKTDSQFAEKWGELGPVYGKQWRSWYAGRGEGHMGFGDYDINIDQISNLINDLKTNPDSRRLMVNAWNVGEIDQMVLPPCHYGFQCYTYEIGEEERIKLWCNSLGKDISYGDDMNHQRLDDLGFPKRKLSLKWTQRSCDVFLGVPFNIASYGLLLHMLSKEVNMIPDELLFSGGDCHIYLNHIEQCKVQLKQKTFKLSTVEIANKSIFDICYDDIKLLGYESSPSIKGELSN